ncbi:uncharacterized protein TRAVEDRAFT_114523, partial [Trametes versicolor FP-101664 SS1]|uniref:uncharacterized protein n=1 Tax=Trametes versicolor (strain FP-101664) TaxID=717944 RepID=UPI0004624450
MVRREYSSLADTYATWKEALICFDAERLSNRRRRFREYEQFSKAKSTAVTNKSRFNNTSSGSGFSSRSGAASGSGSGNKPSAGSSNGLGQLSADDRKLLMDNAGCFKCRRINAGHQSKECPNGFPSVGFKTPAEQLKGMKKDAPRKVAAVTVDNEHSDEDDYINVAAVRATSPLAQCSGVLSEGDSSDDDVRPSPFTSPHLSWPATEWCKLTVSTPDGSWTSVSCKALIVSELCSPLILGSPFLVRNHVLVDMFNKALWHPPSARDLTIAAPRTTSSKPDFKARREQRRLDNELLMITPTPPESTSIPPDYCVAALRERVEALAEIEMLKREDLLMKEEFADCFPEDIPHINELPTDVYHEINLKDANMTIVRRQYDCPKKYREVWRSLL